MLKATEEKSLFGFPINATKSPSGDIFGLVKTPPSGDSFVNFFFSILSSKISDCFHGVRKSSSNAFPANIKVFSFLN